MYGSDSQRKKKLEISYDGKKFPTLTNLSQLYTQMDF